MVKELLEQIKTRKPLNIYLFIFRGKTHQEKIMLGIIYCRRKIPNHEEWSAFAFCYSNSKTIMYDFSFFITFCIFH